MYQNKTTFRHRLVLHSHHQLALEFGINRIHFTEKNRVATSEEHLKKWKEKFSLSTSIHQMSDFEELSSVFDYAFFDPIFESISNPIMFQLISKELEQRKITKPH